MKKLLFAFTLFFACTAYGQFTKGTRTVGFNVSSIGFSSLSSSYAPTNGGPTGSSGNDNLSFSLNPTMGWFINEKVLVGGSININLSNGKYTEGNYLTNKTNTFTSGVGGFGRYYFGTSGFMPYGQISLAGAFGSGTEKLTANYQSYTTKGDGKKNGIFNFNSGVGLGLTKMINKNIGLDIGVGYSFVLTSYKYTYEENRQYTNNSSELIKTNYKYSGTNHGGTLSLGFLIFLDPKNK